jgi:hypothetical protein
MVLLLLRIKNVSPNHYKHSLELVDALCLLALEISAGPSKASGNGTIDAHIVPRVSNLENVVCLLLHTDTLKVDFGLDLLGGFAKATVSTYSPYMLLQSLSVLYRSSYR